jgi:hypothetical protein
MPFKVENADFIADKLASELLPYQENREVYRNSEEAVGRRMDADGSAGGRIEFDVDWQLLEQTDNWYLACADDGDGMTRSELDRYTTTLAVRGAGNNQGLTANQGMGLKISGPTRHKKGVLIRSMKDGECWMVQIGWNGEEGGYGLVPLGPEDELIVPVEEEMFPDFVRERGSGTVVTFLGNRDDDNTFAPTDRSKGWLLRYMNQRFFRLSDRGFVAWVRVPSGDVDEWPRSPAEADERERKEGGKSFNMTKLKGTANIWDEAADRQGQGYRGAVELPGDAAADVPAARMNWWVVPTGPGIDLSSRTASGGSLAVLFQNELHDWRASGQANPFFARLGVLYGKTRIAFVLEPLGTTIASDFARAHVLVGGTPVFESEAWMRWSEQFRAQMPEAIRRTMAEEQARIEAEDPDRARRIRDRLKEVMSLLRPRRFARSNDGRVRAGGPTATGSGPGEGPIVEATRLGRQRTHGGRGIGAVLTQVDEISGETANEVYSMLQLDPKWVTESEADDFTIVNGNGRGLRDRAAALAGEDGSNARIILLNREFRGYQSILSAVNDWANPDGDDEKAKFIEGNAREWIEQKMVEAVTALRQLENGSTWLPSTFDDALSPVALTAAFMADRYHTLREVKRAAGALRQTGGTSVA